MEQGAQANLQAHQCRALLTTHEFSLSLQVISQHRTTAPPLCARASLRTLAPTLHTRIRATTPISQQPCTRNLPMLYARPRSAPTPAEPACRTCTPPRLDLVSPISSSASVVTPRPDLACLAVPGAPGGSSKGSRSPTTTSKMRPCAHVHTQTKAAGAWGE